MVILRTNHTDNSLRCFTDKIKRTVSDIHGAFEKYKVSLCTVADNHEEFEKIKLHFITLGTVDTYTTEWNVLIFNNLDEKYPDKSYSKLLDRLHYGAQYSKSHLNSVY